MFRRLSLALLVPAIVFTQTGDAPVKEPKPISVQVNEVIVPVFIALGHELGHARHESRSERFPCVRWRGGTESPVLLARTESAGGDRVHHRRQQ